MQNQIEQIQLEFELLNLRLAETEAERDRYQQEVQALKSSLTKASSAGPWSRATVAAVSVLAVVSLLFIGVFHDAQSNMNKNEPLEVSATAALETGQIVSGKQQTAIDRKPPSRLGKARTFVARTASQRQWGPSLVMPESCFPKVMSGRLPASWRACCWIQRDATTSAGVQRLARR